MARYTHDPPDHRRAIDTILFIRFHPPKARCEVVLGAKKRHRSAYYRAPWLPDPNPGCLLDGKAEMVRSLLLEGNSVSTIERVTSVYYGAILTLLVLAGEKCERIIAEKVRNVQVRDVEVDEVLSSMGKEPIRVVKCQIEFFFRCLNVTNSHGLVPPLDVLVHRTQFYGRTA